jgi:small acid-soluble spore protein F (minor alpha/beta-type SASP)
LPRNTRSLMSENLKWDLARELGVADVVAHEGWGGVSARNCGNLVKLAVERAEMAMARNHDRRRAETVAPFQAGPFPYWAATPEYRAEAYRS